MKNQLTLFVGVVRRGEFESLLRRGIPVGVILDTNWYEGHADLNKFSLVACHDFNGAESDLLRVVDRITKEWNVTCVLVTYESYVLAGAAITEHLGLPGLSKETALLCQDKSLMHERFVQRIGPQSTAKFKKIQSAEDLMAFAEATDFPIILKPTNMLASLFISLNHSQQELLQNYAAMLEGITTFLGKAACSDIQPQIQAEEFLEGTTHSIDCLIDVCGNVSTTPIVDELTGREIGWNDFHIFARYMPSRLSASQQADLYPLAIAGVQALGITSSLAHVEIIQTAQGPKLLEIGARPGGYRPEIYARSSGIDLIYAYYQIRSGQAPTTLLQKRSIPFAIISPCSHKQGMLTKINHLDRISRLETYFYHDVKTSLGQAVGPAAQGFFAPLGIALKGNHAADVYRDLEEVQSWPDIFTVA